MARNFSLLKRKRFWILFTVGVLLLLFAAIFFSQEEQKPFGAVSSETNSEDKIPPATAIVFPQDKSWHGAGFFVEIRDSDLGSGLVDFVEGKQGCRYIIQDLGTDEAVGGFRSCEETQIFVPVGDNQVCSSSFDPQSSEGRCRVSVKAIDKAGNNSGWKSRTFHIDLHSPSVRAITSFPEVLEPKQEYVFEARVSDSSKVTGCKFWLGGKEALDEVSITPIPCIGGELCKISTSHAFFDPGDYTATFLCGDSAMNTAFGEAISFRVFQNSVPRISACRVIPTTGTISTKFQFAAEASDPDNDPLSFVWDFGDGLNSSEQSPSYFYKNPGTYTPRVMVQDQGGGKISCSTAWVVIQE